MTDNAQDTPDKASKRRRKARPYPAVGLEEVLSLPTAVLKFGGGTGKVRRLTLLESMGKSADSSATRDLITNSSKYGLTAGSFRADFIELTAEGKTCVDPDQSEAARLRARFDRAIAGVGPSSILHAKLVGERLPSVEVMTDELIGAGTDTDHATEAAELFVVNARFLGVLRVISGAERVLSLEHALEELRSPSTNGPAGGPEIQLGTSSTQETRPIELPVDMRAVCFFIAPIGGVGSAERKHSDLVLEHMVVPAVSAVDESLEVVRADAIAEPGRITEQVLRYIKGARLVVADLSFLNPNVFYEFGLRHAFELPVVLLSRAEDSIPFDVSGLRIVRMDMADIYAFVPQIEAYKAEVSSHVRQALGASGLASPVSSL